jgi:hypothetical protein
MERLCKMMEKRIKNLSDADDELFVKLANSIAYITKTKLEIVNISQNIDTLVALGKRKYGIETFNKEKLR